MFVSFPVSNVSFFMTNSWIAENGNYAFSRLFIIVAAFVTFILRNTKDRWDFCQSQLAIIIWMAIARQWVRWEHAGGTASVQRSSAARQRRRRRLARNPLESVDRRGCALRAARSVFHIRNSNSTSETNERCYLRVFVSRSMPIRHRLYQWIVLVRTLSWMKTVPKTSVRCFVYHYWGQIA